MKEISEAATGETAAVCLAELGISESKNHPNVRKKGNYWLAQKVQGLCVFFQFSWKAKVHCTLTITSVLFHVGLMVGHANFIALIIVHGFEQP